MFIEINASEVLLKLKYNGFFLNKTSKYNSNHAEETDQVRRHSFYASPPPPPTVFSYL